jgi:hypothetical protein
VILRVGAGGIRAAPRLAFIDTVYIAQIGRLTVESNFCGDSAH